MDFSPILQPVFSALWHLIPLAILAGLFRSPWLKGICGEFLVNTAARLFLPNDEYPLIKSAVNYLASFQHNAFYPVSK